MILKLKPLALPTLFALLAIAIATLSRRPAPRPLTNDPVAPIQSHLIPPSIVATQPLHHAYLDRLVPSNHPKSMALEQIADFIQKTMEIDVLIDWRVLEAAGIERENPLKAQTILQIVPLSEFLRDALPQFGGGIGMGYRADDHRLTITTQEQIDGISVLRTYDVRDLILGTIRARRSLRKLSGEPLPPYNHSSGGISYAYPSRPAPIEETVCAEISAFLTETAGQDSWTENGGKIGTIHYYAGRLIITQTPDNHERIRDLLNLLRQSMAAEDTQILRLHEPEPGITPKPPTEEHETTVTRIYNIRDLLSDAIAFQKSHAIHAGPAPFGLGNTPPRTGLDALIKDVQDIITDTVDHDSWIDNGGKTGLVKSLSGQLIITQTPANHAKIASLLAQLRQSLKSSSTTKPSPR
jgi:hypothetical protein